MTDMAVTGHQWRATGGWWAIHDRCLEYGSGRNSEAKTYRRLPVGKSYRWNYAVVRLNATGTVQPCICMAGLPIFLESIQICASHSWHTNLSSHCIHSTSEYMILLYCIFWLLKGATASQFHSQIPFKHYEPQRQFRPSHTLQTGTHPCSVENPFGRRLCRGISQWYSHRMLWWHQEVCVSPNFHLLCGLSWK